MTWLAVDKDGKEWVYGREKPYREEGCFYPTPDKYGQTYSCNLPKGSIKKLIGRELTWDDEPVELK